MHASVLAFAASVLGAAEVAGRTVIEAGSMNVNGSVRPLVESLGPASYTGTDMSPGPGVDAVSDAADLATWPGGADLVISTEMLEHAADWQAALRGMIGAVTPGGLLVLTTRSPGYPYHPFPDDHWRFPVDSMRDILRVAGLEVLRCEPDPDPGSPGVFAVARKPAGWAWPDDMAGWSAVSIARAADQPGFQGWAT